MRQSATFWSLTHFYRVAFPCALAVFQRALARAESLARPAVLIFRLGADARFVLVVVPLIFAQRNRAAAAIAFRPAALIFLPLGDSVLAAWAGAPRIALNSFRSEVMRSWISAACLKGLKKEYAEAYKWLRLASPSGSITEKIHLDPIILKMTAEQLQEGERLVKAFIPAAPNSKEATLAPPYMKDIMLKAISGPSNHRLVLINNHTFEKGEAAKIKVGERTLSIKCLDIRVRSALISIEGTAEPKEIKLRE